MEKLLALIEEQLQNIEVICPVCGEKQIVKLEDFGKIRIGTESNYLGTGGGPLVQCEHCKANGKTTLIQPSKSFYNQIQCIIMDAMVAKHKYVDAPFEDVTIWTSK